MTVNHQEQTSDNINSELAGRDIVMIGIQHWDTKIGSNSKNLAYRFAKNNRVLYINFPINRKTYLSKEKDEEIDRHRKIIKEGGENLFQVQENIWVLYPTTLIESINWIPATPLFKLVNRVNNRRFAREIKKTLQLLGFNDIILFNDNDIYNGYYLKELLQPRLYLYYFKDFLQGFNYWKRHASVLEPELVKKVDAVVANSTYYAEYCQALTNDAYYIGQGCNLEQFNRNKVHTIPEEMRHIKHPIIGYVGAILAERLEENILKCIAESNPDWSVVLVGPEDNHFRESDLHQIPNIHFLGRKNMDQLPGYIQAFDVCINPQLVSKVTTGNYPLKIDEYLAMGKPVVATRTKAMKLFEAYSYLADKPAEYPDLIRKALLENDPEKENQRARFAGSHSWENCVAEIYTIINKKLHAAEPGGPGTA